MKIDGIPEGYELVRVGSARHMEQYLGAFGDILIWDNKVQSTNCSYVILRKIQKPKTHRPFKDGAEYAPHFDRPIQYRHQDPNVYFRAVGVCQLGVWVQNNEENEFVPWGTAFQIWLFTDGSPFGVEVVE